MTTKNQTENAAELFAAAASDRNATTKIFKEYKNELYKEAMLIANDDAEAKKIVVQSFQNAFADFGKADSSNPVDWLNQYVIKECIRRFPMKTSGTVHYTGRDEIENTSAVPSDEAERENTLLSVLKVLTPCQRITTLLYFRDHLSIDQVAGKMYTSPETVKSCLTDTKRAIKAANLDLGSLIAILNGVYPSEQTAELETINFETVPRSKNNASEYTDTMNPDVEFTTSVLELKEFFNQQKSEKRHLSDAGIDEELEDEENEESDVESSDQPSDNDTPRQMPASEKNQKQNFILNNQQSDYSPVSSDEKSFRNSPFLKWGLIILVLLLLTAGSFVISTMIISSRKSTPSPEPVSEVTDDDESNGETAEDAEETATPEPTPEATPEPTPESDGSIGEAYIIVSDLTIRKAPGVSNESNGFAEPEVTYPVFEIAEADGYTWYRIGTEQWVPDLAGQYITYTARQQ